MPVLPLIAVAAAMTTINVPDTLAGKLDRAKERSGIPVFVPETMPTSFKRLHPDQRSKAGSYTLDLGAVKGCRGAGACSVAFFTGEDGGKVRGSQKVELAKGHHGRFAPSRCGANCSAPAVSWRHEGAVYTVASKELKKRAVVRMANSAIRHGAR
jgi:hypothetical protein